MKFNNLPNCVLCEVVAPLAGAWIEIEQQAQSAREYRVAPLAGAWIEIVFAVIADIVQESSLPSRERGLKWSLVDSALMENKSLPSRERGLKFELIGVRRANDKRSLPSRERGLKYYIRSVIADPLPSLPSRERGLK